MKKQTIKNTVLLIILSFATIMMLISCTSPVLKKSEFKIVDTVHVSRNGFNTTLGYDVIVKYDSSFYYGSINTKGELTYMNVRKIKTEKLK